MRNKMFVKICTFLIMLTFATLVGLVCYFNKVAAFSREVKNVILISIDTCRADYLSCYGYHRKTTPNIDAVANEGILFENVITPAPVTLPAHSSMMTGTIPPNHKVLDNMNYSLGKSNITLAEILKDNGFTTGAFISSFVLDSQFGLDQGFDTYGDVIESSVHTISISERKGGETNRLALQWLDKHGSDKFFLFLHYFDPHSKYNPPEPFASKFRRNLYAGEIAYVDHCIGELLGTLKELELYDSTLIIITGDHGEMLGEHGEQTHTYFVYQSAIRVPLIFHLPGQIKPQRINHIVGLIDIVPTVCSTLGLETPPQTQGRDLSAHFFAKNTPVEKRYIYCQALESTKYGGNSLLSVVTDRFKYIQTTRPELYDLIKDPQESDNIVHKLPQQARILQEHLRRTLEQSVLSSRTDNKVQKVQLDDESFRKLESLGYVSGNVKEDFTFDQSREDPKDIIGYHRQTTFVSRLMSNKEYDKAKNICQKLIAQRPQVSENHYKMAAMAIIQEDFAGAIPYLRRTIELKPDHAQAHNMLGDALKSQDQFDEAIGCYLKALQIKPNYPAAHYSMGLVHNQLNKPDVAAKYFKEALKGKPEFTEARINLAYTLLELNQIHAVLDQCYRILEVKPDYPAALNTVAWIRATNENEQFRDPQEAVQLARRACELTNYELPELLDTLAVAYAAFGDFPKAIEHAEKAMQIAKSSDQPQLTDEINSHLELFRGGVPYYDSEHASKDQGP